jgi:hypothetical protein
MATTQPEQSDDDRPRIDIDEQSLIDFVLSLGHEIGEWDTYLPDGVDPAEARNEVTRRNVDSIDATGDGAVEVRGSFSVPQVVDRIPAGGGARGEPPINPPEVVTKSREGLFTLRFYFEDLGFAEGTIEVA